MMPRRKPVSRTAAIRFYKAFRHVETLLIQSRNLYLAGLPLVIQALFTLRQPVAGLQGTGFYLGRIEFLHVERPYRKSHPGLIACLTMHQGAFEHLYHRAIDSRQSVCDTLDLVTILTQVISSCIIVRLILANLFAIL